eukprot:Partr_v1_DN29031_c0_g1_i1_m58900 putative HIR histone cell cycle regulation defective homolog A (S. cerevisiae)
MTKNSVSISKPGSISHVDEKDVRTCIYSLHFHPTIAGKLATGGLDAKIRIWNVEKFMASSSSSALPFDSMLQGDGLQSTLALHNGAVMCVRFSPDGRYLASGSDSDNIVIIWEPDTSGYRANVFGSSDVNKESWKCAKRLSGHQSDVVDLAWSPDQQYLATCGLDNCINVWSCDTFERVRKLTAHEGFVKGVCWDPVGKYLVSQADDRCVIFWNTFDWSVAKRVEAGFEKSLGQTFFKRLAWSPDGTHICAVHAVDQSKILLTASLINRLTYEEEACLVGFRGVVECAAFNPNIFYDLPNSSSESISDMSEHYCVCALGSQDGTISIWFENSAHAPFVLEDAFSGPVYDLSWSLDGMTLAATGSDGTVTFIALENHMSRQTKVISSAFGAVGSQKNVEKALARYGYERGKSKIQASDDIVESVAMLKLMRMGNRLSILDDNPAPSPKSPEVTIGFGNASSSFMQSSAPVNVYSTTTINKDGKRRIQPSLISSPTQSNILFEQTVSTTKDGKRRLQPVTISSPGSIEKRPRSSDSSEQISPTLPAEPLSLKPIALRQSFSVEIESTKALISVLNPAKNAKATYSEISYIHNSNNVKWTEYLQFPVVLIHSSPEFVVAACFNHAIVVWSTSGRRLLPPLYIDSQIVRMDLSRQFLMVVSSRGSLSLWNLKSQCCILENIGLSPILNAPIVEGAAETCEIINTRISNNGLPLVSLNNHQTFTFHTGMRCWIKAEGTTSFDMETDFAPFAPIDYTTLDIMEKPINFPSTPRNVLGRIANSFPPHVQESISIAALEERISIALSIKEADTFKRTLSMYARRIGVAGDGHQARVREMLKFLDSDKDKALLGMDRRALLADVVLLMSPNNSLHRVLEPYVQ